MDEEQSSNLPSKVEHPKYYHEHFIQYSLLVVGFLTVIVLLTLLGSTIIKLLVIFAASGGYFLWGIWHHYEEKNLSREHIYEYLAVAALIFVILSFIFINF